MDKRMDDHKIFTKQLTRNLFPLQRISLTLHHKTINKIYVKSFFFMAYKLKHYKDHLVSSYGGRILNVHKNYICNYICILNLLV
jgi:hypothetical protein